MYDTARVDDGQDTLSETREIHVQAEVRQQAVGSANGTHPSGTDGQFAATKTSGAVEPVDGAGELPAGLVRDMVVRWDRNRDNKSKLEGPKRGYFLYLSPASKSTPLAERNAMVRPDGSASGQEAVPLGELMDDGNQPILPRPKAAIPVNPTEGNKNQAEVLLEFVQGCTVFLDLYEQSYIEINWNDRKEDLPVKSTAFRRYLINQYEQATGKTPSPDAVKRALDTVDARVVAEGVERIDVRVRVAGDDSSIIVDCCDEHRNAVTVTRHGWTVGPSAARFRRSRGMLPLPVPKPGGSLDNFQAFINVEDEEFRLIVAWLTAAYRPTGPYPVLAITGEQGSAKSTLTRMLRSLVDPSSCAIRSEPKDLRDLMVSAINNWVLAYENISGIPGWMSDTFCRLATGGGHSTRALYENQEEQLFDAQRPIVINGIADYISRADLVDRCIFVHLPAIDKRLRRTERDLWGDYWQQYPFILGALFDAVSAGMQMLPSVELAHLPRMADFAIWGEAVGRGLDWGENRFLSTYLDNAKAANEILVEDSPVAAAVVKFLERRRSRPTVAFAS